MILSKPLYEALPSFYLASGSGSVLLLDSNLALAGGVLLFCLGALIWVMRSNYRRQDQAKLPPKGWALPESLYEFMPFLFVGTALLLLQLNYGALGLAVACICLYRGCSLLYQRHRYRNYAWEQTKPRTLRARG